MQDIRRTVVKLDPETAIQELLVFGLRYGKQIVEHFRLSFELTTMNFESSTTSDEDDVAVREPEIRANEALPKGRSRQVHS